MHKGSKNIFVRTSGLSIPQLEIGEGEMFGLVGNSGAEKTTMFRLIFDLIATTDGEVLIRSIPVQKHADWKLFTGFYFLPAKFRIEP